MQMVLRKMKRRVSFTLEVRTVNINRLSHHCHGSVKHRMIHFFTIRNNGRGTQWFSVVMSAVVHVILSLFGCSFR